MGRLLNFLTKKIDEDGEGVGDSGGTTTTNIATYAKKIQLARRWTRKRSKPKSVKEDK